MTVSKELLSAVLSMDANNRGYNQGISGLSDATDTQIGTAQIRGTSDSSLNSPEVVASFYAVAYAVAYTVTYDDPTYGTIISYRGTGDKPADVPVDLALSSIGSHQQDQVVLAQKFFDKVDNTKIISRRGCSRSA